MTRPDIIAQAAPDMYAWINGKPWVIAHVYEDGAVILVVIGGTSVVDPFIIQRITDTPDAPPVAEPATADRDAKLWELYVASLTSISANAAFDITEDVLVSWALKQARAALEAWEGRDA